MELNNKKINGVSYHLLEAIKNRKGFSIGVLLLTIFTVLLMVWNIKCVELITSLLVSKSVIDSMKDIDPKNIQTLIQLLKLPEDINPDQIMKILASCSTTPEFYQAIIQEFFYKFISYDGSQIYINIWGVKFGLFVLAYSMITDIIIIIIMSYIKYIFSGNVALAYENKLRRQLISKLIDQDVQFFDLNQSGQIISTVIKDSGVLNNYIKEAPVIILLAISTTISSAILMLTISWKLALCVFGLLILFVIIIFISIKISNKATRKINAITEQQNNDMSEKIYSIKLIKSSGTFEKERKHFDDLIQKTNKKEKKKFFVGELPSALIIGGVGSFSMASIVFGVFLFINDTQSLISIISSFTTGVITMTIPIMQLRPIINEIPRTKIAACNISKLLESEIRIDKFKTQRINEKVESIKFDNISFIYPNTEKIILKDFSVKLVKGKKYAFVGPTGSGKSTIAKLLLRFYEIQNGEILINNNINLRDLNLKSWLDKIGYVDQEPQILSGSIYDNVAYGLENKTIIEIEEACKKSKLHDLIMTWPDGYKTILAERGAQLSGGQKQRLVIARLILKDPEILILDEATSALDNIVESEIQKELEVLMEGRTTISIAHRLSTIKNFDKIFVLEPGVGIVQTGNFEELTKKEGLFKALYKLSK
ncbi:ABC transporter ATP-binding protein [Mesoplasma corruscae]|uniref:ABC transporter ATP-binding protein n=1 Tax=Mesoplasma corruscae TaxID=216874 RepID=A0A2S5RH63_9MOLU|nr:ABC transporter ATP-binding protein [Mesoplasma corruscae]PPE06643.1 ABC transporter ATP-binding protein [Mesoplasma corruscae]